MTRVLDRLYDTTNYLNWGNEHSGQDAFRRQEEQAARSSRELRDALNKAIFKFGFKYSITTEEARHLLLNTGVKLPRTPFLLSQAA